jgi:hypothetical protein
MPVISSKTYFDACFKAHTVELTGTELAHQPRAAVARGIS